MKQYKDTPYYVTPSGDVYRNGKKLKGDISKGYHRVRFSIESMPQWKSVHRLVAELFIDNPSNKPHINHINNIRDDNRVENLEWVTHSENMLHCISQDRGSNKLATEASRVATNNRQIKKFKDLLGLNYHSYVLKNKRRFVYYKCPMCGLIQHSRSDSSVFKSLNLYCKVCQQDEDIV